MPFHGILIEFLSTPLESVTSSLLMVMRNHRNGDKKMTARILKLHVQSEREMSGPSFETKANQRTLCISEIPVQVARRVPSFNCFVIVPATIAG